MTETQVKPGDWVRFYQNGQLVIGQVAYVTRQSGGHLFANTDRGSVRIDSIYEVRSPATGADS